MNEEQDKKEPSAMEKFFAEFLRIGKETNFGFGSNKTAIKLLSKKMKMTQQERIEQAAREHADSLADGQYFGDSPITRARLHSFKKGAEYALSHQWISVDEELPPIDEEWENLCEDLSVDVIVKNEYGQVTTAFYSYSSHDWHLCYGEINGDDYIYTKITHWAEIPTLEGGEE